MNRNYSYQIYFVTIAALMLTACNHSNIRFSEHLIDHKYEYAYGLAAVDLDGDGDLDLTSSDIRAGGENSCLFWYRNEGKGEFRQFVIGQNHSAWFERHAIGDINADGRPDVLVVDNNNGRLLWFANNPDPAAGPWQDHVLTTDCPRAYDVVLVDLDGDGDLDAASSGYTSGQVNWYENPGANGWAQPWPRHTIDHAMPEARTIRAGDFDRDGDVDLLASAAAQPDNSTGLQSHLVWYENPGRPALKPWKTHIIEGRIRGAIHGHPVDMDNDGDLDVVMAFGMRRALVDQINRHAVVWYEDTGSPGQGQSWQRHRIATLPGAHEAFAVDLDTDGDIDVVATAWEKGHGKVVWYENNSDPRHAWTPHILKGSWDSAGQVIAADLTGNGWPDLAATADDGANSNAITNELRWWQNKSR